MIPGFLGCPVKFPLQHPETLRPQKKEPKLLEVLFVLPVIPRELLRSQKL
jgi:hypothetical protein